MFKLLVVLFLLLPNVVYGIALSDLRSDIRTLVQDKDNNAYRWSDATLNTRINQAQDLIVTMTRCLSSTTFITTVADQREYTLPDDYLMVKRTSYLSQGTTFYKTLELTDRNALDRVDRNWETLVSSIPTRHYIDYSSTGSACLVIGLDPKPQGASYVGQSRLRVEYYCKGATLATDSDIPFKSINFLTPYHRIIIWYVAYLCKLDDKLTNEALLYYQNFGSEIQIMMNNLQKKADWSPIFPSFK